MLATPHETGAHAAARSSALGWGQRDWLERDPDYANLRGDPRFERLVQTFK